MIETGILILKTIRNFDTDFVKETEFPKENDNIISIYILIGKIIDEKNTLYYFCNNFFDHYVFFAEKQTDLEFARLKGNVKFVQSSSIYLGTKDKPIKSPKRYYYIESYGLDGNISEKLDPEQGIKYVYQFVDGFCL